MVPSSLLETCYYEAVIIQILFFPLQICYLYFRIFVTNLIRKTNLYLSRTNLDDKLKFLFLEIIVMFLLDIKIKILVIVQTHYINFFYKLNHQYLVTVS